VDFEPVDAQTEPVRRGEEDLREFSNNFSPINIHAPDYGRFPEFAHARPMQVRQGTALGPTHCLFYSCTCPSSCLLARS
jgi:hypothetical protein